MVVLPHQRVRVGAHVLRPERLAEGNAPAGPVPACRTGHAAARLVCAHAPHGVWVCQLVSTLQAELRGTRTQQQVHSGIRTWYGEQPVSLPPHVSGSVTLPLCVYTTTTPAGAQAPGSTTIGGTGAALCPCPRQVPPLPGTGTAEREGIGVRRVPLLSVAAAAAAAAARALRAPTLRRPGLQRSPRAGLPSRAGDGSHGGSGAVGGMSAARGQGLCFARTFRTQKRV